MLNKYGVEYESGGKRKKASVLARNQSDAKKFFKHSGKAEHRKATKVRVAKKDW